MRLVKDVCDGESLQLGSIGPDVVDELRVVTPECYCCRKLADRTQVRRERATVHMDVWCHGAKESHAIPLAMLTNANEIRIGLAFAPSTGLAVRA